MPHGSRTGLNSTLIRHLMFSQQLKPESALLAEGKDKGALLQHRRDSSGNRGKDFVVAGGNGEVAQVAPAISATEIQTVLGAQVHCPTVEGGAELPGCESRPAQERRVGIPRQAEQGDVP